ncbi:MAG: hypothetical protein JWO82_3323, partial [Akkermansiaceae bacterium]|nr:hypothetical protein [Akkermansiaceae bacterium]
MAAPPEKPPSNPADKKEEPVWKSYQFSGLSVSLPGDPVKVDVEIPEIQKDKCDVHKMATFSLADCSIFVITLEMKAPVLLRDFTNQIKEAVAKSGNEIRIQVMSFEVSGRQGALVMTRENGRLARAVEYLLICDGRHVWEFMVAGKNQV